MINNWQLAEKIKPELLAAFPEVEELVLQLLFNRGLTAAREIDDFLQPNYEEQALDPFLFREMERAVARLMAALKKRERVMIYGDYDADGVCATAILFLTLRALGLEVETYIPFRETEGYGLNASAVRQIIDGGFSLVFTVDCGVSNVAEIEQLKNGGVDTVVLDHHQEPLKRPAAVAIVNPSLSDAGYPFRSLCGAGVVFKFVQAVMATQARQDFSLKLPAGFDKWLLDLVAIATVGDVVPLLGENRLLVKYGLVVLAKGRRPGLKKMLQTINNHSGLIDAKYLAWRVVPRLNAAGRINHASMAFNLLTAKDEAEAEKFLSALEDRNKERQQLTDKILKAAEEQVAAMAGEPKLLWAVGEGWPAGVVGLVAGRLCDKYHRPALVIGREGDKYVGSGRSIENFDITQGLKTSADFLARFGGHSQACGFTVVGQDNFEKFQQRLSFVAEEQLAGVDLRPRLVLEAKVELSQISWQLIEELEKFEPFGQGNPEPLFAAYGLKVESVQPVGSDGKHLRLLVSQADQPDQHKLIGFSFGEWCAKLNIGDIIDIAFNAGVNEWNGRRELQLKLVDLRKASN